MALELPFHLGLRVAHPVEEAGRESGSCAGVVMILHAPLPPIAVAQLAVAKQLRRGCSQRRRWQGYMWVGGEWMGGWVGGRAAGGQRVDG